MVDISADLDLDMDWHDMQEKRKEATYFKVYSFLESIVEQLDEHLLGRSFF